MGGGQASWMTAKALRRDGYSGRITLIGDEDHPPYERPPLSKALLLGSMKADETYFATEAELAALDIVWIIDRVTRIDRNQTMLHTPGGARIAYDRLLLATGGRPRELPIDGITLDGVVVLRTLADAATIGARLVAGKKLVVVGGGWIGLEVAASARKAGLSVTVIETSSRLCARALPEGPANFLQQAHTDHGVDVRLGVQARRIAGVDCVERVELDDGESIEADMVLVGVGMVPNVELAAEAELAVEIGIVVDAEGRTSDRRIFAAGDVAEEKRDHGLVRTESWANANEQAEAVAAAMLGLPRPERSPPWFWSDQYDINLQILGDVSSPDAMLIGDASRGEASWCYFREGRLVGIVAANRPRDIQVIRRALQRHLRIDAAMIEAAAGDLAQILKAAPSALPAANT
ncbi:NAD(P)/FAD-dependent oxidoreductase [Sphingopyxis sp. Q841]|uniref:NAD(P)/FAD-dependent oxidoreductase n=1 Tax=Sphingopyxis sp. Q841 TaxID=3458250 RepID=UPI004036D429